VQRLKNLMIPFIKSARRPDIDRHAILQLAMENISPQLQREAKPQLEAGLTRIQELANHQRRLLWMLRVFLVVTLILLGAAVVGFLDADQVSGWRGTPWLLRAAGAWLAGGPIMVMLMAAPLPRPLTVFVLLVLATPALAAPVRCQTHHKPTLNRLQTICDDGTRAVSTWSPTLQQWQTVVTPPPGLTCTGEVNSKTQHVEGRCR
jgi:pheromone shutdown protein TraB